jgi:hypothetical protein
MDLSRNCWYIVRARDAERFALSGLHQLSIRGFIGLAPFILNFWREKNHA